MHRRISVAGGICNEIKRWIEENANRKKTEKERLESAEIMIQSISHMGHLKRVSKGGVLEWIKRDPVVMHMKKVNGRISSTIFIDADKKKKVKVKIEAPNVLPEILGINTVSAEGSIQSLRIGASFGYLKRMWSEGQAAIIHRWGIEAQIDKNVKSGSIIKHIPDVDITKKNSVKAKIQKKEDVLTIAGEAETAEAKEKIRRKWKVGIEREICSKNQKKTNVLVYMYSQKFFPLLSVRLDYLQKYFYGLKEKILSISIESRAIAAAQIPVSLRSRNIELKDVQGVCSLHAYMDQFGIFFGGSIDIDKQKKQDKKESKVFPALFTSFIFGGEYVPAVNRWADSVQLFWSANDLYEAQGLLAKISALSIHVSKEY